MWRDAGRARCAEGGLRIQTTWSGGVTARFNREFAEADLAAFRVEGTDLTTGTPRSVTPRAFADLDDGDNHVELCVDPTLQPTRIVVAADTAFDPTNNPNPLTGIPVEMR